MLHASVANTYQGHQLDLKIGEAAPQFSATLSDGSSFQLKDLNGSYVLIDFWASWNLTCRKQNDELNKTFQKYRDRKFRTAKKFFIVSISLDDLKEHWKLAIQRDELLWKHHICDFYSWNSPYTKMFGINQLPANFLLDASGKIVAKNIWFDALNRYLEVELLPKRGVQLN